MAYTCRQCQQVSDKAGACPVCNIPMDTQTQNDQPIADVPVTAPVVPTEAPAAPEAPEVAPVVTEEPVAPTAPAEGDAAPPVA
jgi:hypothetical protein